MSGKLTAPKTPVIGLVELIISNRSPATGDVASRVDRQHIERAGKVHRAGGTKLVVLGARREAAEFRFRDARSCC